ncbi:MAG: hypothetical protein ACRDZW_00115, partial [Acidimicrobiales bacterium]
VEPTGGANYRPVPDDVGGLAWAGHLLYLSDSAGLRVFDLGNLGRSGTDLVLPQSGTYARAGLTALGLDAASSPPALVTAERGPAGDGDRLVRWPLDGDRLLPSGGDGETVLAGAAWQSTHRSLAAVAAHGGAFLLAGGTGTEAAVWVEQPGRPATRLAFPEGVRGLSLLPATGHLWTATDPPGRRVVVAVPVAL